MTAMTDTTPEARLLVVEDEPNILELLSASLRLAGSEVGTATGRPVMAIGGFNGSDPAPTLAQFQQLVAEGRIHWFLGGGRIGRSMGGSDTARQISAWVAENFTATSAGGAVVYDLTAG